MLCRCVLLNTPFFYLGEKFRLELQQAMFTSAVLLCLQTACSKQDTVDSTLESEQGCNTEYQIHSVGPRYVCGSHKVHIHIYTWLESQKASPPTTARSCSLYKEFAIALQQCPLRYFFQGLH